MTTVSRASLIVSCLAALALAGLLGGCGGGVRHRAAVTATALQAFQLPQAGSRNAALSHSWQQYGSRPVDRTLTINPMTLDNTGGRPLVLLGVRQLRPVHGLVFGAPEVTVTPGFTGYSEYVGLGQPSDAFGMHANFSPLRGFIVNPNPHRQMSGVSPTVVMTVRATRPGLFHIGDWVVAYRVGTVLHHVRLLDDGLFCAGRRDCPGL